MVIAQIQKHGPLAPDLDGETATDVLWVLNDPAHYTALVTQRGWPEASFRRWLAATMRAALLPAGGDADP
jgi:hypothetical protein